jgi:hypothetical protein
VAVIANPDAGLSLVGIFPVDRQPAAAQTNLMKAKTTATKRRGTKDFPTTFQITKVHRDSFALLAILNRKQLQYLVNILNENFEKYASSWRGQYQALAKAIVEADGQFQKM